MTKPKPLTEWQESNLPPLLPRHIRRNIIAGNHGCWLWTRSRNKDGYGWASLNDKTYEAHRLVYKLLRGDPPAGKVLDHLCRVRHCVNPEHLEPVTNLQNLQRSPFTPAGMVLCAQGHALIWNGRQRRCPICLAQYQQATRHRRIEYLRRYRAERRA